MTPKLASNLWANAAAREPEVSFGIERDKTDGKPCVKTVGTVVDLAEPTLRERVEPVVKAVV